MIEIRAYQPADAAQLPRFLALAAHEDEVQNALANPALVRYIENFGRAGDAAVVAQDENGAIIGFAWARLWTSDDHGFGWVDEATPEMAVALEAEFRGQGTGARLIEALKSQLRAGGAERVSLNVRAHSPAVRLYGRLGFEPIAGSERTNRVGGQSWSMSARLW